LFLYVPLKPFKRIIESFLSLRFHFFSVIFLPKQVLAEPCDHHDQATEERSQSHVREVVFNFCLQVSEASGGGWSLCHWKRVVEHRAGANATAFEVAFEVGDELKGLLVLFLVILLLVLFGLLLRNLLLRSFSFPQVVVAILECLVSNDIVLFHDLTDKII